MGEKRFARASASNYFLNARDGGRDSRTLRPYCRCVCKIMPELHSRCLLELFQKLLFVISNTLRNLRYHPSAAESSVASDRGKISAEYWARPTSRDTIFESLADLSSIFFAVRRVAAHCSLAAFFGAHSLQCVKHNYLKRLSSCCV
jgi:hypothetical protein